MNREIKFRAWDTKNKKFIEFGPLYGLQDHLEGTGRNADSGYEIMQYTGLKDKNGIEIYEGDIVSLMEWQGSPDLYRVHPNKFRVDWSEDYAKFEMYSPDELWGNYPDGSQRETDQGIEIFVAFNADEQEIEIIGNIYENPELSK